MPADLYVLRMQWLPYLSPEECRAAGAESCEDFLGRLQNRSLKLQDAPGLSPQKRYALKIALQGTDLIPPVEAMGLPQPTRPGLYEINTPDPQAPVLVSGNSEITLTCTQCGPGHHRKPVLSPAGGYPGGHPGYGLDLREVYPGQGDCRVGRSTSGRQGATSHPDHPGLAAALSQTLAAATAWDIRVGPVCALELPLYFGDYWLPPLGT